MLQMLEILLKRKHTGQLRKNGKTPYFSHLKDVVKNLRKMKVTNKNIICAAWLHDTIEDTDTDFDSIKDRFGKKCCRNCGVSYQR